MMFYWVFCGKKKLINLPDKNAVVQPMLHNFKHRNIKSLSFIKVEVWVRS